MLRFADLEIMGSAAMARGQMKRIFLAVMFWGIAAQAADVEYTKVGAWSIRAITNNDGTLNRCSLHLNGPQGVLRIAVTPDMKVWTVSVPADGPQMKLRTAKVWGEPNWEQPHGPSIIGRLFNNDKGMRAWTTLTKGDLQDLRTAKAISIKITDRENPTETSPSIMYNWPTRDLGRALAALPACVKSN